MLRGADVFYVVANRLRLATLERLRAEGQSIPSRSYVTTGQVAWDQCDCSGQLAATITSSWLASSFPGAPGAPATAAGAACGMPLRVAMIELHLTRCAANVPEGRDMPTAAALDGSGLEVVQDAWALTSGAACVLAEMEDAMEIGDYAVGALTMMGPTGGCVGSMQAVTVGVDNVCQCED